MPTHISNAQRRRKRGCGRFLRQQLERLCTRNEKAKRRVIRSRFLPMTWHFLAFSTPSCVCVGAFLAHPLFLLPSWSFTPFLPFYFSVCGCVVQAEDEILLKCMRSHLHANRSLIFLIILGVKYHSNSPLLLVILGRTLSLSCFPPCLYLGYVALYLHYLLFPCLLFWGK